MLWMEKAAEPENYFSKMYLLNMFFLFFFLFAFFTLGIELDEDGSLDGSSDLTIRGRLMSLVEKVTYLKKKQADKPVESASKQSCKHRVRDTAAVLQGEPGRALSLHLPRISFLNRCL